MYLKLRSQHLYIRGNTQQEALPLLTSVHSVGRNYWRRKEIITITQLQIMQPVIVACMQGILVQ